jgi:hypothetical protein
MVILFKNFEACANPSSPKCATGAVLSMDEVMPWKIMCMCVNNVRFFCFSLLSS